MAAEVRDAKRFDVYKQLHEESQQMSNQMSQMQGGDDEEDGQQMDNEMEEQPDEEDEEDSQQM